MFVVEQKTELVHRLWYFIVYNFINSKWI